MPIAMPTCILWRDLGTNDCIRRNTNPNIMAGFMVPFWGKIAARSGQELNGKHKNIFGLPIAMPTCICTMARSQCR